MTSFIRILLSTLALSLALGGCETWEGMSHREKSTVIGAGVGGAAGAAVTNGNPLGTIGGAAAGGIIGNEVGKHR